jgi:hypothetical protein
LSARDNSRYTSCRNSTLLSYRRVLIAEVLMVVVVVVVGRQSWGNGKHT